jgi:molybdenum cofactor synthesis domain-containing protein
VATPTNTNSTTSSLSNPSAAVLLIGNEILSGRTQDLNLSYMATRLADHGIRVSEARVIPDIEDVVVSTLNELRTRNTYVFTTGGIGPTHDDITADCIAKAFGVPIDIHPEAEKVLMDYWAERNVTPNSDRLRMARIPEGASLIDNPVSAAPGFCMGNVFVMAGVPRIMQAMFDSIVPTLQQGAVIASVSVRCNLGEGDLAIPLRQLQAQYPAVDLGSYPGKYAGAYAVTLVARSTDAKLLNEVQQALITLVDNAGGQLINE